ncbi:MAG: FtsX-like permease family protein, partial [Acidobacteria bacterium]|nr:FtsX-like permease family protein [Acidobacteriota bacterium]
LLAALALAASRLPPIGGMPAAGYAAALAAIGAAALAAPALTLAADRAVRWLLGRHPGVELLLAARSLTGSLARTSVIIAALATAIAMMASVAILVGSFRQTVLVWLETQLRADLYVRPAARSAAGEFLPLDREAPARAKTLPGVEAVDIFHALEFRYRGERSTLGAGDLEIVRRYGRLTFLGGPDRDAILRSLPGRDRAIVSEPFANRHGLAAGDRLRLALGERSVDFEVAGVYYDYSSSQGYVILDRSTLLRYLPGQPATNLAVYLAPGADPIRAERRLEQLLAPFGVVVAPNRELRRNAVEVFDRTFAITYALEAVAILVAMLGAASSLLALVLDRRRETALLRYLGAAPGQIRRIVIFEAGALGLLAALLGLALGLALSALLIYVVNKQSFGWTIQFHPPLPLLAAALALVWGATVASSLYPARVAARLSPTDVIRND